MVIGQRVWSWSGPGYFHPAFYTSYFFLICWWLCIMVLAITLWKKNESSQVVDFCDLVVKRLFHISGGLDVSLHLAEAFDAFDVARNRLLFSVESVLAKPLDEIKQLKQVEVQIAYFISKHVVLFTKVLHDRCDFEFSLLCKSWLIRLSIAWSSCRLLDFFHLGVHKVHLTSLMWIFA